MLSVVYADCPLCWVSHKQLLMLGVIMLNVIMLSVVAHIFSKMLNKKVCFFLEGTMSWRISSLCECFSLYFVRLWKSCKNSFESKDCDSWSGFFRKKSGFEIEEKMFSLRKSLKKWRFDLKCIETDRSLRFLKRRYDTFFVSNSRKMSERFTLSRIVV